MKTEFIQRLKDIAMSDNLVYILNTVGVYSYLSGYSSEGFNPSMTVEAMMQKFSNSTNNQYSFQGRRNGFIGKICYDFENNSITPPSAKGRPGNGLRCIEDGEDVGKPDNGVKTVWQYYRSVIVRDEKGTFSVVRLFNTPVQNSYRLTPLNQNLSMFMPVSTTIIGYMVTWRIICIDFKVQPNEASLSKATKDKIDNRFADMVK